jgi:Flp pilus assembly protein TadB
VYASWEVALMQVRHRQSGKSRWPSYTTRREEQEQAEWRRAAWNMFWLLAIGKLVIMIALAIVGFHLLHPSGRSWGVIALLNWSWILLAVILVIGPLAYRWRLHRVRRKRLALIHAEWNVE